jgi:hypothetical protein
MECAYAEAAIPKFAAWVHERDVAMRGDLERRGYSVVESSRAMGMTLDDLKLPSPEIKITQAHWSEHLRVGQLPTELLKAGDHAAFHVLVAELNGDDVATATAFDLGNDCGIYNVMTRPHARRCGLGIALTLAHLHDGRDRGCHTASVQSTGMAEGVYAAAGFRHLGRILEYAPPNALATGAG